MYVSLFLSKVSTPPFRVVYHEQISVVPRSTIAKAELRRLLACMGRHLCRVEMLFDLCFVVQAPQPPIQGKRLRPGYARDVSYNLLRTFPQCYDCERCRENAYALQLVLLSVLKQDTQWLSDK